MREEEENKVKSAGDSTSCCRQMDCTGVDPCEQKIIRQYIKPIYLYSKKTGKVFKCEVLNDTTQKGERERCKCVKTSQMVTRCSVQRLLNEHFVHVLQK